MIQSPTLRVVLALSSTLQRARVRVYLERAPGIALLAEVATAAQMVQVALVQHPHVVLCDLQIVQDPLLIELRSALPQLKAALISTDGVQIVPPNPPLPVIGYLPLHLESDAIAPRLSALIAAWGPRGATGGLRRDATGGLRRDATGGLSPLREPSRADLSSRFTVVENASPPPSPTPTGSLRDEKSYRGPERRHPDPSQPSLEGLFTTMLQEGGSALRDGLTGSATTAALTQALAFLPRVKCPTAFISIEARYLLSGQTTDNATLRRVAAAILANVRRTDLVCRVDDSSFVLLLPGLDAGTQRGFLNRMRVAIPKAVPATAGLPDPAARKIVVGVAFWEFGIAPLEALSHSRQALRQG